MADYIKGEKPRDLDAAVGGPTLDRVRDFHKDQSVMLGPKNTQNYAKGGPETNDNDGDEPKRTGDKSLSLGSLKKSKASAL